MFLRISIMTVGVILALTLSVALAFAQASLRSAPKHNVAAPSQPGQPFKDPHGRYRLAVPAGWDVSMAGDDPIFRNGKSWIQVRVITANSPSAAVDQATTLFRSQFTAFNTINRGNTTIAGRASHGLNIDGMTTEGQRVSVLFTAQPAGNKQYFVLVSQTPVAQAPQLNLGVMALANSVRFDGE